MKPSRIPAVALWLLCGFAAAAITTISPLSARPASAQAAALQSRTFVIRNMTCALCPVTVKKAMEGVKGVKSVTVNFNAKTATAVFDPSVTSANAIAGASASAGYPATIEN